MLDLPDRSSYYSIPIGDHRISETLKVLAGESNPTSPLSRAIEIPRDSGYSIRLPRNLLIPPEYVGRNIAIASAVSGGIEICSEKGEGLGMLLKCEISDPHDVEIVRGPCFDATRKSPSAD